MSETGDTQQPIGDWPDGDDIWVPTAAQPPAAPQSVPSVIPTDIPPVFAQPAGGAGDGGWPDDGDDEDPDVPDAPMRPYLLQPGEPVLLGGSPLDAAFRFGAFLGDSGLPEDAVLTSTICAIPLPKPGLPASASGDTPVSPCARRVNPEWAWHPLAWLPPSLSTKAITPAGDVETDDAYAARVAIELTVSGVYDVVGGRWLDVPACAGIDTTTPEGRERVVRWQQGAADPILDSLSIEWATKDHTDPGWSLGVAQEIMPTLIAASIAQGTDALILEIDDILSADQPFDAKQWGITYLVKLARTWTREIDDAETTTYWATAIQALEDVDDAGLPALVSEIRTMIQTIRDEWWPVYAETLSVVGSIGGQQQID